MDISIFMRYHKIYLGRLDMLFVYYNLSNVVFSILKYVMSNIKDDR
jgi:hypothetical protein